MSVWLIIAVPTLTAVLVWLAARVTDRPALPGWVAVVGLALTAGLAWWAAATSAQGTYRFGPEIPLTVGADGVAGVIAVLVAVIATVVLGYAAAHEDEDGRGRLLALLTLFVAAMELLVLTTDLLGLTIAFESVGGLSWALISHRWRDPAAPQAAAHAFNATRAGGLGLFLASGAAFTGTGTLAYDGLGGLSGPTLHVVVGGVLLAAVAKSAQGPFAPWLYSAMAGPTSVSALLHSSTMVAAGAYILIRLHPILDTAAWFGPVTIAIGLTTAIVGGVVALLQTHVKKLLAASTSAQYGLMFVAVGAGYPAVAALHLIVHAVFKAQLFMAAGVAMEAVGSTQLGRMRLGRALPLVAGLSAAGAAGLAAVPPSGGGWSKEAVTAAAGHISPWLAVAVVGAGGLSAAYATRWWLLAFKPLQAAGPSRHLARRPHRVEEIAIGMLAAGSVLLGVLWLPAVHDRAATVLGGEVAAGPAWEIALSLTVVVLAVYAVWSVDRATRLGHIGASGASARAAEWLLLPTATRRVVVAPTLATAHFMAAFDDWFVDGIVRGAAVAGRRVAQGLASAVEPRVDGVVEWVGRSGQVTAVLGQRWAERGVDGTVTDIAWLVDRAGRDVRRSHTGMIHNQFVVIAVGTAVVVIAAILGR